MPSAPDSVAPGNGDAACTWRIADATCRDSGRSSRAAQVRRITSDDATSLACRSGSSLEKLDELLAAFSGLYEDKTKWNKPDQTTHPKEYEQLKSACSKGIKLLLEAYAGHIVDPTSQLASNQARYLLCVLRCLMREENCEGQESTVLRCLELVRGYPDFLPLQIQGAATINNLAFSATNNRVFLCRSGAVELTLRAMCALLAALHSTFCI